MSVFAGCCSISNNNDVEITPTKQWEGHYYSVKDVQKAVDGLKLEKNESVWMISNRTLNRVLQNTGK